MKILDRPQTNGHAKIVFGTASPKRRNWRPPLAAIVALVVAIALAVGSWTFLRPRPAVAVATQPVTQGTLASNVTATGTVNAQNTVNVGTQVSGTIAQLFVDYNSKVKKGQVLARLDPTAVEATLAQGKANLAQSQAQAAAGAANATGSAAAARAAQANISASKQAVASAQAQIAKTQAADALARRTVARDSQLLEQGYIAQSQYDTDQSNAVAADAALKAAQIAVMQAEAQEQAQIATAAQNAAQAQAAASTARANQAAVSAQQAQVAQAQYNANNTVITSPVNGTVIARDISVGQTVAAGFQTPTLFSIAQDLTKMEVDLQVGEPDIGNVRAGDQVHFTVLAYPTRTFTGTISQVRENATTVQNVVTYTTVVLVDNKDGALLPGMTANATIQTASLANATIVPVAALQWHNSARPSASAASPWGSTGSSGSSTVVAGTRGRVFIEKSGKLQMVPVHVEMVSGTNAAVTPLRGMLNAGDAVVTADGTSSTSRARSSGSAFGNRPGGAGGMRIGGGLR